MPTVTLVSTGQPFVTTVTETGSIAVGSLAISNHNLDIGTLGINGSLSITHALNISGEGSLSSIGSGIVTLWGSVLSAGSVDNAGTVRGMGSINSAGLFLNEKNLFSSGMNLTASAFTNLGMVTADSGDLHVTTHPGGFTNLSGSTLSGGSYTAIRTLYFN